MDVRRRLADNDRPMGHPERRSILITGCSSGIGYAAAVGLHARGYRVFASARRPEDVARLAGTGLEALRLDLDDPASIAEAAAEVLTRTEGGLHALFNNGGYGQPGAVEDLTREALRAQFETLLFGWHDLTRRLIPAMRAQGRGRIVQNSSVLGLVPMAYRGAYVAAKYALEGLTDTLRLELQGTGIHVSLIEPGPIESRFRDNAYRKFLEHVDADRSAHRERYAALEARLRKPGPAAPFTLPAQAVLPKLIHALESPHPRIRYRLTVPTHLLSVLARVLPDRLLDRVLTAASGGGRR